MEPRWAGKIEHDGLVPPMSVCLLQECSLKSPNQLWPLIAGEDVGLAVEALQPRRQVDGTLGLLESKERLEHCNTQVPDFSIDCSPHKR